MERRSSQRIDGSTIEKYKGMIYKLAIKSWRQLPPSVKMWVSVEDLVADAYLDILSWNKSKYKRAKAGQSTFLWCAIGNMYINFAAKHCARKRFGWRLDLEDIRWLGKKDAQIELWEELDSLARTYREASPLCQERIRQWFGQEPVRVKRSEKEKQIYQEFAFLAKKNGLSIGGCRKLMRGGVCVPS